MDGSPALAVLYDAGAHFVLCKDKCPIRKGWQWRRPPFDLVEQHGPDIGVIPASLHMSALDVDSGDIAPLVAAYPPLAHVRSPHGHHLYYADTEQRGNKNWAACGCSGQVRSAKGFLRLYEDAADRLADAVLSEQKPPFPAEIVSWTVPETPASDETGNEPMTFSVPQGGSRELDSVPEGARNVSLFDAVRLWAYQQDRGQRVDAWVAKVHAYALQSNARFPSPLPPDEVRRLAYSVATWCWQGSEKIDHSPTAQRRRAIKSGQVRRALNAERDTAIRAAVQDGKSKRAVARQFGLSEGMVRHIMKRRGA